MSIQSARAAARSNPQPGERTQAPGDRSRGRRAAPDPGRPFRVGARQRSPWTRGDDERERTGSPTGGPLAHQRPPAALAPEPIAAAANGPPRVGAVADRILTGVNAAGEPTARIELNLGDWAGVDVDLVAGARGIELNVFAATAAARRTIQAQLTALADALAQRGLRARKIGVSVRRRDNGGGSRQDERR